MFHESNSDWLIIAAIILLVLAVILAIWHAYAGADAGMWVGSLAAIFVVIALILLIIWWVTRCHKTRVY